MFCLLPPPDVGSITLFAVITIILGCLKIGYFVGYSACLSATEGVFPVAHAVHTLVQVNRTMFLYVALVSAKCSSGCAEWRLWGGAACGELESISWAPSCRCLRVQWDPVPLWHPL